jgi:hypothetical protein
LNVQDARRGSRSGSPLWPPCHDGPAPQWLARSRGCRWSLQSARRSHRPLRVAEELSRRTEVEDAGLPAPVEKARLGDLFGMSTSTTEETAMKRERRDRRLGRGRFAGLLVAATTAALLAGALPAAAGAADYCVAPKTSCGGTNMATFGQALGLAGKAPDADRIFLGAATYTAPTAPGYGYNAPSAPLAIIG